MTSITVELPKALYEQLQRAATLARQPIEKVVAETLSHTLPPLLNDIPTEYQADVYPLLQMEVDALRQELNRVFSAEKWQKYEALLSKKKEKELAVEEVSELATLRREADILMFRKGYAAVLLKRRGYTVSAPKNTPPVQ